MTKLSGLALPLKVELSCKGALWANRMFSGEQYCNIAMQCNNINVPVARRNFQSL